MDTLNPITPATLGDFLINGVREIDLSCSSLIDGVQIGLRNVKRQFAAEALEETGHKLTEELLISWLLAKQLSTTGLSVVREQRYRGSREECDLLVALADKMRFWIEIKLAWKNWLRNDGLKGFSSNYRGYLFGDESHRGTVHDFDKLERVRQPDAQWLGVLLIGFDSNEASMTSDIQELIDKKQLLARGWSLTSKDRWADRRNTSFGISAWFWMREATA